MNKKYIITDIFQNYGRNRRLYLQEYIENYIKNYKVDNFHPERYVCGVDLADGVDYTSIVIFSKKPQDFEWITSSTLGDDIEINWQITK